MEKKKEPENKFFSLSKKSPKRVMKMIEKMEDKRYTVKWTCLNSLVSEAHLLPKIEKVVDFEEAYPMVEHLYCEENGHPAVDPVVLVKIVLIQHLYGIASMRRTVSEIAMNMV